MKKPLMAVMFIMGFVLFVMGCSDDETPTNGNGGNGAPTFAADVLPIFTASCGVFGCHDVGTAEQGMVLTADSAYINIVGVASTEVPSLNRVEAGEADNSYIIKKLEGTQTVGAQMPFGELPLSDAQIRTIRDWIDAGALDN